MKEYEIAMKDTNEQYKTAITDYKTEYEATLAQTFTELSKMKE